MGRRLVTHIVSARVNDAEMKVLQGLAKSLGVNISTLLRQGLSLVAEEVQNSSRSSQGKLIQKRPFSEPTSC